MGRRRDTRRGRGGGRFGEREELDERVVDITRVAKVVKGGRRFSFRVVVVVGDNEGKVGVAIGKARGVPDAIRKAMDKAKRFAYADTNFALVVTNHNDNTKCRCVAPQCVANQK